MRPNGSQHWIGCSNELMYLGPKFLQWGHSVTAVLLSLSIPGQDHFSCSFSRVWSHPKCPFSSCASAASLVLSVLGAHSTFATLSVAFVHTCHSLSPLIMKFVALCLALRLVWMSGMSWFVSASTTSLSQGLSANRSRSCACSLASVAPLSCMMSFVMPWLSWLASQSGRTDQSAPSLPSPSPLASDHFLLMASTTTLVTPGRCQMSVMFLLVIDSSHLACVEFCLFLSRTSRSAWQSVSISIGDP